MSAADDDLSLDDLSLDAPTLPVPPGPPTLPPEARDEDPALAAARHLFEIPTDAGQLNAQFGDLPAITALVGQKLADAVADAIITKADIDAVRAMASAQARGEIEKAGKKATEAALSEYVDADGAVHGAVQKHANAMRAKTLWQNVLVALEYKRDALINLGANGRVELAALNGSSIRK